MTIKVVAVATDVGKVDVSAKSAEDFRFQLMRGEYHEINGERATALGKALLLSPNNSTFLAGMCRGLLAVGVAQSAVTDADPFVCVQAQRLEDFFALVAFDFFLGAVDPDATEPEAVSGVHKVPHGERTVVQVSRDFLFREDEQNHGRTVERVETLVPTANLAVHFGDAVAQLLVCDGDHGGGLLAHAACSVDACFGDLCNELLAHGVRFEFADAPTVEQSFDSFVHKVSGKWGDEFKSIKNVGKYLFPE